MVIQKQEENRTVHKIKQIQDFPCGKEACRTCPAHSIQGEDITRPAGSCSPCSSVCSWCSTPIQQAGYGKPGESSSLPAGGEIGAISII
jgi:hypothetical protein